MREDKSQKDKHAGENKYKKLKKKYRKCIGKITISSVSVEFKARAPRKVIN